ncbi:HNH endonuclease signature motif containing protein [Paenibacillus lutimineralis]|uniref:HNH endonuclease n=1 Tax=Paenibacillus lutimineralis TaxID=2707005 RepID=A0A3S9UYL7_9BACL|nr:HNH endonuclease signature motif containing protein [Paenibacillus lutimineralis]AZS15341.1 HNH endonuclease [Paenibacillus lutimineralis]
MHRWTDEQKQYIHEIAQGRYNSEIADLFNSRFGTDISEGQIKSFKANHKIKSNVPRKRITGDEGLFTQEQKDFIRRNVSGRLNEDLADLVNKKFSLQITARQMNTYKKNHGLVSGLDCRFLKGSTPANKGTKGLYNVGGNRTSFKKGQQALNYKPVGSERIDRDGYTLIKVSDEGPWNKRWRHKHKVIWEEKHGPIPKGHVILFADQNRRNIDLDNLIMIKQSQLSVLNKKGLLHDDAELTKTGIIMADIYLKIGERKKLRK